jgi:hypothetical protein
MRNTASTGWRMARGIMIMRLVAGMLARLRRVVDPAEQFWNLYGYGPNNPVNGIDPDGRIFIIDDFIIGAAKGAFSDEGMWDSAVRHVDNSLEIWGGLLEGDFLQVLSRFTWELPQSSLGFFASHTANMIFHTEKVKGFDGSTVLKQKSSFGAITLGNYIIGDNSISARVGNELFMHEYGHYIQSQNNGIFILLQVGIPSIISATFMSDHRNSMPETSANYHAKKYFKENYNFQHWNNRRFPAKDPTPFPTYTPSMDIRPVR